MRDPHVETLRYRVETANNVTYNNPPSIGVDEEEFNGHLEDGIFACEMKSHYPSIETAKKVVDQYLRAWEIEADLTRGRGEIRFIYEDAKVIDRNPPPPDAPKVLQVEAGSIIVATGEATMRVTRRKYPDPPQIFRVSPDVETLWGRYQGYLDGKEPLLSMAYFCLTVLETRGKGNKNRREAASKLFAIKKDVLDTLGRLTTQRGDNLTARKAQATPVTLSGSEEAWIEKVIKLLIRRIGEYRSAQTLPQITMADLPPL